MKSNQLFFYPVVGADNRRHTVAGVIDGSNIKVAVAACSTKDQFVKATGRKISLERAESNPVLTINLNAKPGISPVKQFLDVAKAL